MRLCKHINIGVSSCSRGYELRRYVLQRAFARDSTLAFDSHHNFCRFSSSVSALSLVGRVTAQFSRHILRRGEPTPIQIDGLRANPTMRVRPCPLQRGHRTSLSATRIGASGSRRLTVRSRSITVPQASHTITRQWCFDVSAPATVGQNQVVFICR